MKNKIEVGSKVIVSNNGNTYSTYSNMFIKMNFKNQRVNGALENGKICTVFGIESPFEDKKDLLYGIRDEYGREALMSEKGLMLFGLSPKTQSDEDFEKLKSFCVEMELDVTSEDIFKYLLRTKISK